MSSSSSSSSSILTKFITSMPQPANIKFVELKVYIVMSQPPEKQQQYLQALSDVALKPHSFKQNPHRVPPVRRYKPTRQVIGDEQKYVMAKENVKFDTPTYTSITSPPSLKPQKHYCDITGLEGRYKNPANSLRFHNVEIYQEIIKNMPPGVDQDYLELRGANVILK